MPKRRNTNVSRSNRRKKGKINGASITEFSHLACSITDPFCPAAFGARRPEGSNTQTITFHRDIVLPITTNVDGQAVIYVRPSHDEDSVAIPTITSGTAAAVSAMSNGGSSFPSFVSHVRVVSAGFKVWGVAAHSAAGGLVTLNHYRNDEDIMDGATKAVANFDVNSDYVGDYKEQFLYTFPYPDTDEFEAKAVSGAVNTAPQGLAVVNITGPASTTTNYIRILIHYEAEVFEISSSFQTVPRPIKPNYPLLQYLREHATSGVHAVSESEFGKTVKSYASQWAAQKLLVAASTYVAGPTGGAAVGLLTN